MDSSVPMTAEAWQAMKRTIEVGQQMLTDRTSPGLEQLATQIRRGLLTPAEVHDRLLELAADITRWS